MKVAFLGSGFEIERLREAADAMAAFEIVDVGIPRIGGISMSSSTPSGVDDAESWESLLAGTMSDGVVFAGDPEDSHGNERLRKLVQSAVPTLVIHPACDVLLGYELQMIQRDTQGVLLAFWPGHQHPLLESIEQWIRQANESPLGEIDQLSFQRVLPSGTMAETLDWFSRDAAVLGRLLGRVTKLGALGTASESLSAQRMSVHMSSDEGAIANWSITPRLEGCEAELTVIGQRGRARLLMTADPADWALEYGGERVQHREWRDFNGPLWALQAAVHNPDGGESWRHATNGLELADTVQQSLRRGKTIDLYGVEPTEEATFKTMMAAGGCLALTATVVLAVLMMVLDSIGVTSWGPSVWRKWPILLVATLLVFLALQLLRLVFPDPPASK